MLIRSAVLALCLVFSVTACGRSESKRAEQKPVQKSASIKKPSTPAAKEKLQPKPNDAKRLPEPQVKQPSAPVEAAKAAPETGKAKEDEETPGTGEAAEQPPAAEGSVTLSDVQRKTREAIMTIEAYAASKEREYHQKIDAQFERFDLRLTRLRKSAKKLSEEAKTRVSQEVRQLQSNLENTQQNLLGKLEVSNEDDVRQLEENLNQMVAQMEQSLAQVKP